MIDYNRNTTSNIKSNVRNRTFRGTYLKKNVLNKILF
jgi:hypothetical protein